MSVIGAINLTVERTQFSLTNGTAPAAAVDLEPNHPGQQLTNVSFIDCWSYGNRGGGFTGFLAHLDSSTVPIDVTVRNWTSRRQSRAEGRTADSAHDGRDMYGFAFGKLGNGLRGAISIVDSVVTDSYNSGIYVDDKSESNRVIFKKVSLNATCWSGYCHSHPVMAPVYFRQLHAKTMDNISMEQCEVRTQPRNRSICN